MEPVKGVCLHHCAAGPLSWLSPFQEDQPERCTWPCARGDPSCTESVREDDDYNYSSLLFRQFSAVKSLVGTELTSLRTS